MTQIRARQLSFRYRSGNWGFETLSFDIEVGSQVMLEGASRSGKSTLTRCLSGLIPHVYRGCLQGELTVAGCEIRRCSPLQLMSRVGILLQNPHSQMLTSTVEGDVAFALENQGWSAARVEARVEAVLRQLDLSDLRSRSPVTLSTGQQQKVALAAVLAREPEILILDEPFSMLDLESAEELRAYLHQFSLDGHTVIAADHRPVFSDKDGLTVQTITMPTTTMGSLPSLSRPPAIEIRTGQLCCRDVRVDLGGRAVLRGIDCQVGPGEIVGLAGRNGAGKTTLLRCLAGLQSHAGTIRADGKEPNVHLAPQDPNALLHAPTVREEIFGGSAGPTSPFHEWLIEALRLTECLEQQPLLLSEGQKKRVALAASLTPLPGDALLLDEPSVGQDLEQQAILGELIQCLGRAGLRCIVATHDLEFLTRYIPRTLILDQGRVVRDDDTHALFQCNDWCRSHGLPVPPEACAEGDM